MSAQLELIASPIEPPEGSQCALILARLKRGERLNVVNALQNLHVYALSQRCGQLRNEYGWPIKSHFVGKIKEYYLAPSG